VQRGHARCGRQWSRLASVIIFDLAIHDGEVDSVRELIRLCVRSMVDDGCGVEDGDVGEVAGS